MTHEFDTPEELDAPQDEATSSDPSRSTSKGSFLLLVVALLVLAGGAVSSIGAVLSANSETDAAQASAEDQLELFDPTEFACWGSLPLDL